MLIICCLIYVFIFPLFTKQMFTTFVFKSCNYLLDKYIHMKYVYMYIICLRHKKYVKNTFSKFLIMINAMGKEIKNNLVPWIFWKYCHFLCDFLWKINKLQISRNFGKWKHIISIFCLQKNFLKTLKSFCQQSNLVYNLKLYEIWNTRQTKTKAE